MIRIFEMGDAHIGKTYDRYPEVKDQLIRSRFDALKDMVGQAEKEGCEFFVVTGDLFDSADKTKVSDVKEVFAILAAFTGHVIVLPGNHDYYSGEEKVWRDFEKAMGSQEHNITLITKFMPYEFESGEERVVFYPAFCQSKHSHTNNLSWIRDAEIDREGAINIGLAHGTIVGVSPDPDMEYFPMTEGELLDIPVDAWLIGHTHIPYPDNLKENEDTAGFRIFNAGTHEQTDLHNNTAGYGFILAVSKTGEKAEVRARKYRSGKIHFHDVTATVGPAGGSAPEAIVGPESGSAPEAIVGPESGSAPEAIVGPESGSAPEDAVGPDSGSALEDAVRNSVAGLPDESIVRLTVKGSAGQAEYEDRADIFGKYLSRFLTYETDDSGLSEEITIDKIRSEYAETSFAAKFLEKLTGDKTELQMAYELLKQCRED